MSDGPEMRLLTLMQDAVSALRDGNLEGVAVVLGDAEAQAVEMLAAAGVDAERVKPVRPLPFSAPKTPAMQALAFAKAAEQVADHLVAVEAQRETPPAMGDKARTEAGAAVMDELHREAGLRPARLLRAALGNLRAAIGELVKAREGNRA